MDNLRNKDKIILALIIMGIILFFGYNIYKEESEELNLVLEDEELIEDEEKDLEDDNLDSEILEGQQDIIVHIEGAVRSPGLVILKTDDRVKDAIDLAGGFTEDAEPNSINLARKVEDEEKIYVGKIGEEIKEEELAKNMTKEKILDIIDINTCTKEELMTLPGIGEVTANKILDYRESNIFINIEDLMKVSGIGPKKFEAIKDLIRTK